MNRSSHDSATMALSLPALALIRTPGAARTFSRVMLVALAAAVVALVVVPWQQTSQGTGRVIGFSPNDRQQFVEAPIEGRILHWYVQEGSRVEQGDPLFEISDNDPEIVSRLRQERTALEARLEAARTRADALTSRRGSLEGSRTDAMGAASERARMAVDRIQASRQSLAAAEATDRTARLNFERQKSLADNGLASRRAFELAELEQARAAAELERARANLSAAERDAEALERDRSRVGNDTRAGIEDVRASHASALAEMAAASAELARLDVRLARQSSQYVTAPRKGTVRRIMTVAGIDMVKMGDAVALLVPDTGARAVEMWVDGNDVPLLKEGRRVRLQFEGWPALQLSGWPNLSTGTFGGVVAIVDAADDGKGKFRIVVVPGDHEWPPVEFLRQGVRANGWVMLESVSLGYELWRQFNGFPPVVPPDVPLVKEKG
jgi:adhesin transport system membrane fusion protein